LKYTKTAYEIVSFWRHIRPQSHESLAKTFVNIENVVATANLKQQIDLNFILRMFPGVEYRPELFPGLVYRLKKPKTATLLFSSGKMVCTGAKSKRQAKKAVMKVVDHLKRNGIVIVGKPDIQIQNIVASGGLGGTIDLEKATYSLRRTMYEPEQFPGLIYRMEEPKVVILLFATGKFVCVGAKMEEEIYRAAAKLQETLEEKELIHYEQEPHRDSSNVEATDQNEYISYCQR
jgi:transcription initiation factor TFIID TATA-box-binding protein